MTRKSDIQAKEYTETEVCAQARDCAERQPALGGYNGTVGAPPSNTAPSNCKDTLSNTTILRTGIDSLYLSYRGDLKPEQEKLLTEKKLAAQASEPVERAQAIFPLSDHQFEVKDKGKGKFAYVLADNWYHLQVASSRSKQLPMVYAQVSSEILSRTGLAGSLNALSPIVQSLGSVDGLPMISRVDLCVDFVTDTDWEALPRNSWVTRATQVSTHHEKRALSGYTFGLGGNLSCRLYNKRLEIEKSGKDFFLPLWEEAGWDGSSTVWRLEFQVRRPVLHECGIRIVPDLKEKATSLWWLLCSSWLRLTVPQTNDSTRARWPNHPIWDALANATWTGDRNELILRSRKSRPPSERHLFINGLGAITSYMALSGITNIAEGGKAFLAAAHDYHQRVLFPKTGRTLTGYANEKAADKARKYNLPYGLDEDGKGAARYQRAKGR